MSTAQHTSLSRDAIDALIGQLSEQGKLHVCARPSCRKLFVSNKPAARYCSGTCRQWAFQEKLRQQKAKKV